MIPGLQIGSWFLAITAVIAFTVWAEAWLKVTAAPKGLSGEQVSPPGEGAQVGDEVDVIRAA